PCGEAEGTQIVMLLKLSLISAVNLAGQQTAWVVGSNPPNNSVSVRVKYRIVKALETSPRFGKNIERGSKMVSDPSRHPIIGTIVGGREEIIGRQIILMVECNMK